MSALKRQLIGALLVAGFTTGGVLAQTPAAAPTRPAVGPDRPFSPPGRSERTLPNGLRIVIVQKPTVPKVSVLLTLRTGLAADPGSRPGLASMTAAGIQEGTKSRNSRQIRDAAFGMGASLDATVAQDYTTISLRGLSEFTPGLIELLSDVVMNPTFPDSEVDILKANRLQELQQLKSEPQFLAERAFRRALFGPHPYARISSTPDALSAMDREALAGFHATHYRPGNAFLLVVGDISVEPVFHAAQKAFAGWQGGPVSSTATPPLPPLEGRSLVFVERPSSVQSSISLGNFSVKRTDPSWYNLSVANTIYGGAFNSRIVRNIREEKGYTYSPFSQFGALARTGFFRFAADVRNEVTGPALNEIYREIDKLRAEGASGAELEDVKRYLKGVFVIAASSQAGLTNVVNNVNAFGLPADYLETYQPRISAVAAEDVKSAAATLFGSENSLVVIVGEYSKVKDQLTGFSDIAFQDLDGNPISKPGTE